MINGRRVQFWTRRIHRLFAYLIGIQVLLWILGGVVFAWVPFDGLIKGGDVLQPPPAVSLPEGWLEQLQASTADQELRSLRSHASAQGVLLELESSEGIRWLRLADGVVNASPTAEQVSAYASSLYRGGGGLVDVERIDRPSAKVLGLVDELYDRRDVWRVSFDDWVGTRLYFEGATGRYLTVRNDFWVLYDAFWRLHIMDYRRGADFNNLLLTVAAACALVFSLSGLLLMLQTAWRQLRISR